MDFFLDFEFIENGVTIRPISIGLVASNGAEMYKQFTDVDLKTASEWVQEHVIMQLKGCAHMPELDPRDTPTQRIIALTHQQQRHRYQWLNNAMPCGPECVWLPSEAIALHVETFVHTESSDEKKPRFWGYYADYDWVAFAQLFGKMIDLPDGYPQYCRDLKQWCDDLGNPRLTQPATGEHNALVDARWNRDTWDFLNRLERLKFKDWFLSLTPEQHRGEVEILPPYICLADVLY